MKNADTPVIARILIVANAFDDACSAGAASRDVVKEMALKGAPSSTTR